MTQSDIESIASKHLGKAADGTVVKPYVTPDAVDSSLLVSIPRHLNRIYYEIKTGGPGTQGYDVWNCFEVSFLLANGYPVSCFVRIVYDSQSANIVESKSLKLYLNSYNMAKMDTMDVDEATTMVKIQIIADLQPVLGVIPSVGVTPVWRKITEAIPSNSFYQLEDVIDHTKLTFNSTTEDPSTLHPSNNRILTIKTSLLRSNCRVTNQPDWGDVYIYMEADHVPEMSSVAEYIVSMRKENHFHEEIAECIYKRLHDKFKPFDLFVVCLYTRRGGIDINPVRYSNDKTLELYFSQFSSPEVIYKTTRQ